MDRHAGILNQGPAQFWGPETNFTRDLSGKDTCTHTLEFSKAFCRVTILGLAERKGLDRLNLIKRLKMPMAGRTTEGRGRICIVLSVPETDWPIIRSCLKFSTFSWKMLRI